MTQTEGVDAPDDEYETVEGGPWAGLVVLLTATALFFATFALIYFLSSTFRADPPSVGTSAPLSGTAVPPANTIDVPVLPGSQSGPPPAGTIDIPVLSSKPTP